jgi:two-component system, OmpR family, sensor histidine kinase CiaH
VRALVPRPAAPDVFGRATTRLVALFTTIVVLLVVASGVFMYLTVRSNITDVAERHSGELEAERESELARESIDRLRWQLVALDGVIIVAIGTLGYWYARRTLSPIRDLYGAQKRFVADASHELRTPLAIMKADFEVALRERAGPPGEREAELSEAVHGGLDEVDRMGAIVDDLLTLSRIDAHQEELRFSPIDLAELVRHTGEALGTMAEAARVAVKVTAPDSAVTPPPDAAHLERALRNVVRNAIEHSSPGDEVGVALSVSGDAALLRVVDSGAGIAPADLEHVFDRFYRADSSRSRNRGGSGLGLAIARWIVERHGGVITAESAPGEGTTVVLRLPLGGPRDRGRD